MGPAMDSVTESFLLSTLDHFLVARNRLTKRGFGQDLALAAAKKKRALDFAAEDNEAHAIVVVEMDEIEDAND